jgi:hypothetical protein
MFAHTKPRYSVNDLLGLLSIGRARLYADINAGKLETYKVGKRRFTEPVALERYVDLVRKEALATCQNEAAQREA